MWNMQKFYVHSDCVTYALVIQWGFLVPSHVVQNIKGFLRVLGMSVSWTVPDVVHLGADIHGCHGRHALAEL